ncbi:hypothetical protein V5N11_019085 [Cardamine amara subsp. amara]|uniref:Uncharacterized protein n=1 Tax=Cardamine amara subsp. amara TaxID=228776 RepID=A0ABD0ZIR8_CARAN
MVTRKRSRDSSEKENWDAIFKNMVQIIRKKDDQLESLFKRWKILEDGIKKQQETWVSDVLNYKLQLSLMEKENETLEMMRLFEIAKFNLLLGLKERDCFNSKDKLEHLQKDLDDFKAWFDIFTMDTNEGNSDSGDEDCKSLEDKIRKQKLEFEKLAFGKSSEFTTLLQENGFAWSQFKGIESGFTDKLLRKDKEIEQLQSSNHEKDKIISRLKAEMEDNASNKDNEIARHLDEVKPLRRSPRLNRC